LVWILVGVAVIIVAAVGVLGFVTPGWFNRTVFDHNAMNNGVKGILVNDYKEPSNTSVSCPSGQQVKKGNTFSCTAVIDGQSKTVDITVTSDSGVYEVAQPK